MISVALATFNGEKYINEQLESLLTQKVLPFELVVGDDGSTDGTINIVEKFRTRAPFPVHIHRNESTLGYAQNFLATAMRCQGKWIAFCDQDDFWLPNKLAEAVSAIKSEPDCCMILQNAWLCDATLTPRNRKFPGKLRPGFHRARDQYGFWVWPGFLKTVRSDIMQLLGEEEMPRSWFLRDVQLTHDKWTCIIANAIGGIVVLDNPTALYRRHDGALTGDYNRQSLRERISKAHSVAASHYNFLSEVAGDCAGYMDQLSERTENTTWASAFHVNSRDFRKLQETQRLRSNLYASQGFVDRLPIFLSILREGGYFGTPFTAMGTRSAVKDAFRVIRCGK